MLPFSILNFTLYLKENPLNYLVLQSLFQVICKQLVSKRVMLLHLLYHPHRLNGTPVPVVEETKFLGVIFDRKLSFIPHIKHLKDKCTKALNLLRVLAHSSWGADQATLLHLYSIDL